MMDEFFKELFGWLEEQENKDLDAANECGCFEEVDRADAFRWCADRAEETTEKIKELRKKYKMYDKIS